jgi:hypothetical protein
MQYFIFLPGDKESDALNEANLLGEESFGVFWASSGLKALMMMVDQKPELLPHVTIRNDVTDEIFTIEKFLSNIQNLEIRSK